MKIDDTTNRRLSKTRYISREFLRLEFERMWSRVWQVAGVAADLAKPGDYFTYQIGNDSILVVRQIDGVRAYHNVCRHRGTMLCESAAGHARSFRCPYHHWEWEIDGRLKAIPLREKFPQIRGDDDLGLREIAVCVWAGFVWVNFATSPERLEDYLDGIGPMVDAYRIDDYALIEDQTIEIECNWKVAVDANSEYYHIRTVHPELVSLYDERQTSARTCGRHTLIFAPFGIPSSSLPVSSRETVNDMLRFFLQEAGIEPERFTGTGTEVRRAVQKHLRQSGDYEFSDLSDEQLTDYHSYLIFPNVVFNMFGLRLVVVRYRPHPSDPERVLLDQQQFLRTRKGEPCAARPSHRQFRQGEGSAGLVSDQDASMMVRVQKGLRSNGRTEILLGDAELGIRQFHHVLDEYLRRDPADALER
jgi:phenylpropionate dioxygenase-like ring-hydroxylating dioxygenase large terminal subunit